MISQETDEMLRSAASFTGEALSLPVEGEPVIFREWPSQHAIARERIKTCRHLELRQHLGHTGSPLTHYQRDPL